MHTRVIRGEAHTTIRRPVAAVFELADRPGSAAAMGDRTRGVAARGHG